MANPITVAQSLRHARHDFLNELQLIKMNLDLGRLQEAQAIIRSHAEASMHVSRLADIGLPLTEEWLLTVNWSYTGFRFDIACYATAAPSHLDGAFRRFLEDFVKQANQHVDPYQVFEGVISLTSNASFFEMNITYPENWPDLNIVETDGFTVAKECNEDSATISVRAQMEG